MESESPNLMEQSLIEPPAPIDLIETLEAKTTDDHSVIMETVEPIMKSRDNPTPPPSPIEAAPTTTSATSEAPISQQDLLVDFQTSANNLVQKAAEEIVATSSNSSGFEETEVPREAVQSDSLEASLIAEAGCIDSSLVQHVAKTSLQEHEEELANLLKEAQIDDENSPVQELKDIITREKDEGDPWVLDDTIASKIATSEAAAAAVGEEESGEGAGDDDLVRGSAGEALVHLGDSDEMANKDDISHCAVFGDEVEPDDLDLDEDEKQPHRGSLTGSSEDSSSSEGPDEEKPVMLQPTKPTAKDNDDDDDSSSSSEEADNLSRPPPPETQTPPNSATSTDLTFDMGKRGGDLPKPEVAAAKVEETLVELKESAKTETANLIDHLS